MHMASIGLGSAGWLTHCFCHVSTYCTSHHKYILLFWVRLESQYLSDEKTLL